MHPRSKDWHLIDYVITRKRHRSDVRLSRSFHGTCWLSDHALVRCKVALKIKIKHRRRAVQIPKPLNVKELNAEKKIELCSKLEAKLNNLTITDNIEESWKRLRDATYECSYEVLGLSKRKHQDWFDENDDELQGLLDQMHSCHKAWITDKNSNNKKTRYLSTKRTVQRRLRKMKEDWWSRKASELQSAFDRKDTRVFYEGLKGVFGPQVSGTSPVMADDGTTLLTEKNDILNRWKTHFESVLNSSSDVNNSILDSLPERTQIPELDFIPNFSEVSTAVKQMLLRKSPGDDSIPAEIFKFGGNTLLKTLLELFIIIWEKGSVPDDFRISSIIKLFKNKGKKVECDNYRGISLLSVAEKILARIILTRIIVHLVDEIYPETQCGFRSGRGTIYMIFCLRQVAEKAREKNSDLYMVFVDLTKAFDSVNRDALWKVLKKVGIPDRMLNVIISFHENMKARVRGYGNFSEAFNVKTGTK